MLHKIALFFCYIFKEVSLLFFPSLCAYCKKFLNERNILCSNCESNLFPIVSKKIDITNKFSATVFAITDYTDPLRKLILAKGWSDIVASNYLGHLLWQKVPLLSIDCDVIVPVPLHWTRYASRGFNQAEEIARVIRDKKGIPLVCLLKRTKKTLFQSKLVSSMRGVNVKNAFVLNSVDMNQYKNKHILLIDDLMTTGSTLQEAAKVLLMLNPRKITIAVVCRVV